MFIFRISRLCPFHLANGSRRDNATLGSFAAIINTRVAQAGAEAGSGSGSRSWKWKREQKLEVEAGAEVGSGSGSGSRSWKWKREQKLEVEATLVFMMTRAAARV